MISKSSAPGKVILFGEHFVVYGIKAILCAIDKRVTVTAQLTDKDIVIESEIGSLNLEKGLNVSDVDYNLRPFYFLADKMLQDKSGGIKISIKSDIPPGVGLGSSSACCVAAASAISGLFEKKSKQEILNLAINAEKTIFADTSGADCTVSVHGGIMTYEKSGFANISTDADLHLVIANSNVPHSTRTIVSDVQRFKQSNEAQFSKMCQQESVLVEDAIQSLKDCNMEQLGSIVKKNQKLLEQIQVSNDTLYDMIRIGDQTSYGSKITGAGGGGCIYSLTPDIQKTMSAFRDCNYECFSAKIDHTGLYTF